MTLWKTKPGLSVAFTSTSCLFQISNSGSVFKELTLDILAVHWPGSMHFFPKLLVNRFIFTVCMKGFNCAI